MIHADYFLGSRHMGRAAIQLGPRMAHQAAFFCSTCGEVWGRVAVAGECWLVHQVPCAKHRPAGVWDWSSIPGSFVQYRFERALVSTMFWPIVLEVVPPAVLRWEFELRMQQAERLEGE